MSTTRKRTIALLLTLALLLSLCACTQKQKPEPDEPKHSADRAGLPTTVIPRISEEPAATVRVGRPGTARGAERPAGAIHRFGRRQKLATVAARQSRFSADDVRHGLSGLVGGLFDERV